MRDSSLESAEAQLPAIQALARRVWGEHLVAWDAHKEECVELDGEHWAATGRVDAERDAALLEDPRVAANPPLQDALTRLVASATTQAGPIRRHRNRAIGHLDQKAAFGHEPLPDVTLSLFEQVLESLTEIHQMYGVEILHRSASYDIHPLKSAEALADVLELAPTRREWVLRPST